MSSGVADLDVLLVETIARHFDEASVTGSTVDLGFAGIRMGCRVNSVSTHGAYEIASLFFELSGGALGDVPVFASMSGYAATAHDAVVGGGCNWACVFGPVLRAGLAGEPVIEATQFETVLHHQRFRVVVDGLDRTMLVASGVPAPDSEEARQRLGGDPWLLRRVLDAGALPVLPVDRATVVSVFVWDSADYRVVEVKVNGADWPSAGSCIVERAVAATSGASLLRELAVLVPHGGDPPRLDRASIARTLEGARDPLKNGLRSLVSFRGWSHHRGELGAPARPDAVEALERVVGPLPADYRTFLLEVQTAGPGPGYGLVAPFGEAQRAMAAGAFGWVDGSEPEANARGVMVLGHAGCGNVYLLVVSGPRAGEVWIDACGSDRRVRRVAPDFTTWYRRWLDAIVRDDPPAVPWDAAACSTGQVFSRVLESMDDEGLDTSGARVDLSDRCAPGSLTMRASGGAYFDAMDMLDPCIKCVALATSFGLGDDLFAAGVAPKQARARPRGFLHRLFGPREG